MYYYNTQKILSIILCLVICLFMFGLFFVQVSSATEITITDNVTHNSIYWEWNSVKNCNVIIDGKLTEINSTVNYYLLSGIDTEEKHKITVISDDGLDEGSLISESSVNILRYNSIIIFIVWIVCILLTVLTRTPWFSLFSLIPAIYLLVDVTSYTVEPWVMLMIGMTMPLSIIISGVFGYVNR